MFIKEKLGLILAVECNVNIFYINFGKPCISWIQKILRCFKIILTSDQFHIKPSKCSNSCLK